MRVLKILFFFAVAFMAGGGWVVWVTLPVLPDPVVSSSHVADPGNGEDLFRVGGCLSCHAPVDGAGMDENLPSGGRPLVSPVGVFYPPNITPDLETGIGAWTETDFVTAMARGVSPDGRHYFPAFPYTSYRYMTNEDLLDLKAYIFSLPAVNNKVATPDVPFAVIGRALMGPWKWLAFNERPIADDPNRGALWTRGAYLVLGPGHCGECHTPRDLMMIPKRGGSFLAGGPHPDGQGMTPSLRGLIERKRYEDIDDLALALANGEIFGYDRLSSGGMAEVQASLSMLQERDVRAIATFLADLK